MQNLSIRDSKHLNANLNHSKGIRSIRMQIRTTQKVFEPFRQDSKHLNAYSNMKRIRMQMQTL